MMIALQSRLIDCIPAYMYSMLIKRSYPPRVSASPEPDLVSGISPLFQLPLEIRQEIFRHVLFGSGHVMQFLRHCKKADIQRTLFANPLLRTSKVIRNECFYLMTTYQTFSVAGLTPAGLFLTMIGEQTRANLTYLELGLYHDDPPPSSWEVTRTRKLRICACFPYFSFSSPSPPAATSFTVEAVAHLLATCTKLQKLTIYIDVAKSYRLADSHRSYCQPGAHPQNIPGYTLLKEAIDALRVKKEYKKSTTVVIWFHTYSLWDEDFKRRTEKFVLDTVDWMDPEAVTVPRGLGDDLKQKYPAVSSIKLATNISLAKSPDLLSYTFVVS